MVDGDGVGFNTFAFFYHSFSNCIQTVFLFIPCLIISLASNFLLYENYLFFLFKIPLCLLVCITYVLYCIFFLINISLIYTILVSCQKRAPLPIKELRRTNLSNFAYIFKSACFVSRHRKCRESGEEIILNVSKMPLCASLQIQIKAKLSSITVHERFQPKPR